MPQRSRRPSTSSRRPLPPPPGPAGVLRYRTSGPGRTNARATAARTPRWFLCDDRDFDRDARALALAHGQVDREPRAASHGRCPLDEAVSIDEDALILLGEDEPVV